MIIDTRLIILIWNLDICLVTHRSPMTWSHCSRGSSDVEKSKSWHDWVHQLFGLFLLRWFNGGFFVLQALFHSAVSLTSPLSPLHLPLPPLFHLTSSLFPSSSLFYWEDFLQCPSLLAVAQIGCDSCHVTFRAPSSFSSFLPRLPLSSHHPWPQQSRGCNLFLCLGLYCVFYLWLRQRGQTQTLVW